MRLMLQDPFFKRDQRAPEPFLPDLTERERLTERVVRYACGQFLGIGIGVALALRPGEGLVEPERLVMLN
ncbi:hypothetical protein N7471_003159 [Penicillium samsonianum]|uniref:uncharacterized protein n=1 Tax=Penicillium samsonianum TaxID=1882272 RepID=UPI0025488FF9|nr:uncharacterized protein N7471_003159 [Penicillium samsonianum]KAJ6143706.1 hypothetical protein N7471_003159 [Penicillium samsonianum]